MPEASIDQIVIRMYHTGSVGDCFLLQFMKQDALSFSLLIDCGGYKTKKELIERCVKDIRTRLADDTLDLVIATHEHEDHLSGFNQARAEFDKITFKQVWLSWAENEKDPLAIRLLKEKGKKIKALKSVLEKAEARLRKERRHPHRQRGIGRQLEQRHLSLRNALELLDFDDEKGAAGRLKISDAMKYVKKKSVSKSAAKMYRKPGQVLELPGAEGIRFFILGPPYDEDLSGIKDDLDHDEMYALRKQLGFPSGYRFLSGLTENNPRQSFLPSPFADKHHLKGAAREAFEKNEYQNRNLRWRQIEYDWLEAADELAIALTDYVNNTSLAFAIEIEKTGEVLLFPADAQSGNWKSWHDEKVSRALEKNGRRNAGELLEKTIFYKVGHHGSHNGTASHSGLEQMKAEKIVAFLPLVQEKVPVGWGGADNFPAKGLYQQLIDKTKGAVIRTDEGVASDPRARALRKKHYTRAEQEKMKKASDSGIFQEWVVNIP